MIIKNVVSKPINVNGKSLMPDMELNLNKDAMTPGIKALINSGALQVTEEPKETKKAVKEAKTEEIPFVPEEEVAEEAEVTAEKPVKKTTRRKKAE